MRKKGRPGCSSDLPAVCHTLCGSRFAVSLTRSQCGWLPFDARAVGHQWLNQTFPIEHAHLAYL